MVLAPSAAGLFKWRQFEPEVILLAVGWYLRFSLSYRDVEELLAERGLHADHVTVWRWVQRYAPEIQRRLRPRLRPTNDSWRVDETTSGLRANGCIYTGLSTPLVRRSTSFFRLNAMQRRPNASSPKR
jgi:transposase-like protein